MTKNALPAKVKDMAGHRFGRLSVTAFAGMEKSGEYHKAMWRCACDCGSITVVPGVDLRSGNTVSCGCHRRDATVARSKTHGHAVGAAFSGAYRSWRSMRQRCNDQHSNRFAYYGARGIRVCKEWDSFSVFLNDMGDRPPGMSLERIDPNGNYEPGNCKWIPLADQSRNTRASRYVYLGGVKMIQADAARRIGVTPQKLHEWLKCPAKMPSAISLSRCEAITL